MVTEPETPALRSFLRQHPRRFVSRVGEVEVARAAARAEIGGESTINEAFEGVDVIELTADVSRSAAIIQPAALRSLDSIHLASALAIRDELDAFVTYDARLADAAVRLGLPLAAPSSPTKAG